MEQPSSWIPHVEAFVDSAHPSNQQATSVDAISALINNDVLTLEALVRGMEQYLTNSDNVIRARGLLLLAEVLNRLFMKSLDSCTVSSLVAFFTAKLEDWYALRGALIGCLALLKRTKGTGSVEKNDVRMFAESFFKNVAVQSLAVRDRKLALEVLQCLVDIYPQIAVELGDDLVYDVCSAIDEEKDPRCLMLSFHIVGVLGRLFPDSSGPMANFSEDIFGILSQYFPIHFTHPKDDGLDIKKEDLSEALMHAFSSSSFLEPFVVPLLLEKLSSSLPSAKLDSIKYLNSCLCNYGANRMRKHGKAIWSSLKDVIFNFSPQRPLFLSNGLDGDVESEGNQITKEALNCLQTAIIHLDSPNQDSILCLIIDDQDIETKFWSLASIRNYSDASSEIQRELSALGSVLSTASKVSIHCCTEVFQKFFLRLMEMLGVLQKRSSKSCVNNHKMNSAGFNFGALYLTIELLTSCRELTLTCKEIASDVILEQRSWFFVIQSLSTDLCCAFGSILLMPKCSMVVNGNEHVDCAVKGLQVFATFPEFCWPISEATFEDTLVILMSIITGRSEENYLWEISVRALVQIGLWIDNVHDSAKQICYNKVVIERIVSILDTNVSSIPLSLKIFVISEIGNVSIYLLRITRALEDAIVSNLLSCIEGNPKSSESLVPLLDCYSHQILPRCSTSGNFDSVAIQFAITIWNQMENGPVFKSDITMQNVLDHIMMTMKLLVAGCTVESQSLILQKAHHIVFSMDLLKTEALPCTSSFQLVISQCIQTSVLSHRDEWILSLFGSVIIALRPQTPLMDRKVFLNLFMVLLLKGNILAAQSLACMINKWPADIKEEQLSTICSSDQAIEEILMSFSCTSESSSPMRKYNFVDGDIYCRKSVVLGIAWVGKGLLMRGHEKVKDIVMFLLKCLVSGQSDVISSQQHENGKVSGLDTSSVLATSAADAFHVLLNDSEDCLNKKFHATVRPLYKQRFFSSILPILLSSIKESDSWNTKGALYRAFGHVISDTPLVAVVAESKKIMPTLLCALDLLILDVGNKDMMYSLLLILSGILMDENGKTTILENLHSVIGRLIKLICYPHFMIVRETAIQCLVAISVLPHARIYPFRSQVLLAVSVALDDRKRAVRQEAVKCRQAWASVATRSLQF